VIKVIAYGSYFEQKVNALHVLAFIPLQKYVSSLKMLTSSMSPFELDDIKYRMASSIRMGILKKF
jgi:hypothetical protein